MLKLIAFWIILYALFIHSSYAADYQVKIYLDEIKVGTKPIYAASVTFRNTSGRVVKTNKGIFTAPVLTLTSTTKNCRTVSIKEAEPPLIRGLLVVCNGDAVITTPDVLQLIGEPK
jgi:hypothetical protein